MKYVIFLKFCIVGLNKYLDHVSDSNLDDYLKDYDEDACCFIAI